MSFDLYEVLEVESSASSAEIKRAYRKLALKYHPDKVTEDDREDAETRFKEICHAYEVLIDEERRQEYDMYGTSDGNRGAYSDGFNGNPYENFYGANSAGQDFDANDFYQFFAGANGMNGMNGQQRSRTNRTDDANLDVEVTLEDLFKGKVIKSTSTRDIICSLCKGSGFRKNAVSKACGICEGNGYTIRIRRVGAGLIAQEQIKCKKCDGMGVIYRSKDRCKKCNSRKVTEETKILEFEIPRGAHSGECIVLKGESDESPGKITGDVILKFTSLEHPVFTRKGNDLYAKYKIPLVDALCGFSNMTLKHLDGRLLQVCSPRGKVIRPGDFIKIDKEGMPLKEEKRSWFRASPSGKGDLYIEMEIEFPQDNWYLEKNDLLKLKNLLPNSVSSKDDGKKNFTTDDSLPDANVEIITDFSIKSQKDLPSYKVNEDNGPNENFKDKEENAYVQPECTPQ